MRLALPLSLELWWVLFCKLKHVINKLRKATLDSMLNLKSRFDLIKTLTWHSVPQSERLATTPPIYDGRSCGAHENAYAIDNHGCSIVEIQYGAVHSLLVATTLISLTKTSTTRKILISEQIVLVQHHLREFVNRCKKRTNSRISGIKCGLLRYEW